MTTVAKIVGRALRLIQVIDPSQPVRDPDMETGIDALNAMMQRWEADLLSLGWLPVTTPSQTIPIPMEAEQAVAYCLAVVLSPEYGVTPTQTVMQMATSGMNDLLRDQAVATPICPILDCPGTLNSTNGRDLNGSTWYVG
jgi:23S rRNA A2030 N6-methylase RlmJ